VLFSISALIVVDHPLHLGSMLFSPLGRNREGEGERGEREHDQGRSREGERRQKKV